MPTESVRTPVGDEAGRSAVLDVLNQGDAPRKRRGRPRKSAPAPEPEVQLTTSDIKPFVVLASGVLSRKDPLLAFTDEEADRFTDAFTALANKYGAAYFKYMVEVNVALAVGAYGWRVYQEMQIRKAEASKAQYDMFKPKPTESGIPMDAHPSKKVASE